MIYVLLNRYARDDPANNTSKADPRGVTVWVLTVKSVVTPWVPNMIGPVGSSATASAELLFPFWVRVNLALTYKSGGFISCLVSQWYMLACAIPNSLPLRLESQTYLPTVRHQGAEEVLLMSCSEKFPKSLHHLQLRVDSDFLCGISPSDP